MNKNNLFKKTLVFGIIILFIGVSIQPVFADDNKSSTDNTENENDCGCEVVSDAQHIRFEELLNRLEIYAKKLSLLFKDNPKIVEKCEELSKIISKIKSLNVDGNPICFFLWAYLIFVLDTRLSFIEEFLLYGHWSESPILWTFINAWFTSLANKIVFVYGLLRYFDCYLIVSFNLDSVYKQDINKLRIGYR